MRFYESSHLNFRSTFLKQSRRNETKKMINSCGKFEMMMPGSDTCILQEGAHVSLK